MGWGQADPGSPPTTTIQTQLTAVQRADLLAFLKVDRRDHPPFPPPRETTLGMP